MERANSFGILFYIRKDKARNDETVPIFLRITIDGKYAHYKEYIAKGEEELEKLIKENAKSIGWDFKSHIVIATKNKHPNLSKLKEFAHKLSN